MIKNPALVLYIGSLFTFTLFTSCPASAQRLPSDPFGANFVKCSEIHEKGCETENAKGQQACEKLHKQDKEKEAKCCEAYISALLSCCLNCNLEQGDCIVDAKNAHEFCLSQI